MFAEMFNFSLNSVLLGPLQRQSISFPFFSPLLLSVVSLKAAGVRMGDFSGTTFLQTFFQHFFNIFNFNSDNLFSSPQFLLCLDS